MRTVVSIILFLSIQISVAQILSEKDRAVLKDELLEDRFQHLLPQLMDEANLDMWLLISREYNEDPVLKTMLPARWLNARRRTMILFYRNKQQNTIERIAVARYDIGKSIKSAWNKELEPNQWKALSAIITERNPTKIGINYSKHFALADGLVKTDYEELVENLPDSLTSKLVSAEKLAIAWLETRTEKEMKLFKKLVKTTHDIIDVAFSEKVIEPGKTTTEDLVWFLRQTVTDMGLETWFHPTIDIQRTNQELQSHIYSFTKGDKDNETSVPEYLASAFKKGNRLQDILTTTMQEGKTGNEILLSSLSTAKKEGLRPSIYTHPLGKYGHSAGTTIGMWDSQGGVPFNGDYSLHKNTVYAIELNVTVSITEWQKDIRIMLEEAGFYGDNFFEYVNERQTEIKPINAN